MRKLSHLLKIAEIKNSDIKIIHLVRDPRGITASRKPSGHFFAWNSKYQLSALTPGYNYVLQHDQDFVSKISYEPYEYCKNEIDNIKFALNNEWMRSRYMLVTHTQLSLNPRTTTHQIYDFVGSPVTSHVDAFINMTLGDSPVPDNTIRKAHVSLNTIKKSKDIIDKWKSMDMQRFNQIRQIEENCGEFFKALKLEYSLDKYNSQHFLNHSGLGILL